MHRDDPPPAVAERSPRRARRARAPWRTAALAKDPAAGRRTALRCSRLLGADDATAARPRATQVFALPPRRRREPHARLAGRDRAPCSCSRGGALAIALTDGSGGSRHDASVPSSACRRSRRDGSTPTPPDDGDRRRRRRRPPPPTTTAPPTTHRARPRPTDDRRPTTTTLPPTTTVSPPTTTVAPPTTTEPPTTTVDTTPATTSDGDDDRLRPSAGCSLRRVGSIGVRRRGRRRRRSSWSSAWSTSRGSRSCRA